MDRIYLVIKEATMAATSRQILIRLNTETDAHILAYLDSQDNRTEAIRQALRDKMSKEA